MQSEGWSILTLHRDPVPTETVEPQEVNEALTKPQEGNEATEVLLALNVIRNKLDKTVRRGAVVKALAIVMEGEQNVDMLWVSLPLVRDCLEGCLNGGNAEDIMRLLHDTLEATPVPKPRGEAWRIVHRMGMISANQNMRHAKGALPHSSSGITTVLQAHGFLGSWGSDCKMVDAGGGLDLELRIPTKQASPQDCEAEEAAPAESEAEAVVAPQSGALPEEPPRLWTQQHVLAMPIARHPVDLRPASLRTLAAIFKRDTMHIYNAALTEQRLCFYGASAAQLTEIVLATCALVSPPLPAQELHRRAFPYASLCDLRFMEEPGYIAGVLNPMFIERDDWWEVMANVEDGTVKLSSKMSKSIAAAVADAYNPAAKEVWGEGGPPPASRASDNEFIEAVLSEIEEDSCSEEWVRAKFWDYTQVALNMCLHKDEYLDDPAGEEALEQGALLLTMLKRSRTFAGYVQGHAVGLDMDARRHIHQLLGASNVGNARHVPARTLIESLEYLLKMLEEQGEDGLLELLRHVPQTAGGLQPFATLMFHNVTAVRRAAAAFFLRLDSHEIGKMLASNLNMYWLLGRDRLLQIQQT